MKRKGLNDAALAAVGLTFFCALLGFVIGYIALIVWAAETVGWPAALLAIPPGYLVAYVIVKTSYD